MRNHPSRPKLVDYDLGDLSSRQSNRVADHLASCSECRAALQWRRSLRETLAEPDPTGPTPELLQAIDARLAAGEVILLPGGKVEPATVRPSLRRVATIVFMAVVIAAGSAGAAVVGARLLPGLFDSGSGEAPALTTDSEEVGLDLPFPASGMDVVLDETVDPETIILVDARVEIDALQLTVEDAAGAGRFVVGDGRVTVREVLDGRIRIVVPDRPGGGSVRLIREGQVVAVVQSGQIQIRGSNPTARLEIPLKRLAPSSGTDQR